MTDKQLRDEAVTFFAAGHETTAMALTWTLYLLSRHPGVERELHEEADRVLGDGEATFADVESLSYTPFGGGPRACIGSGFAMMEACLVLAHIARVYRLRVVPGHPVEAQGWITLRPRHGLRMTLEKRVHGAGCRPVSALAENPGHSPVARGKSRQPGTPGADPVC